MIKKIFMRMVENGGCLGFLGFLVDSKIDRLESLGTDLRRAPYKKQCSDVFILFMLDAV